MSKIAKHFTHICVCCGDSTPLYARTRTQLADKLLVFTTDTGSCVAVANALWRGFIVSVPGGVLVPGKFTAKNYDELLASSSEFEA